MENSIIFSIQPQELKDLISQALREELKCIPEASPKEDSSVLLTRQEAASLLRISLPTLNAWSKTGTIKSHRVGCRVLYKKADVLNALTEVKTYKSKFGK